MNTTSARGQLPPEREVASGSGDARRARAGDVREMFGQIARRYDLLNSLLSLGLDRRWRKEAAKTALEAGAEELLDAATGTGELALAIERERPGVRVVGVDFSAPMLEIAQSKARDRGRNVEFVVGDVLELPFESASFDAVTIAYGLRNLADIEAGLVELNRVLRPGGRLVILEFPPPPADFLGRLFRFYFLEILPRIGGWVSGSRSAYTYLPTSVLAFPRPPELADLLWENGFTAVRYRLQCFGVSAIHVGEKE